MIKHDLKAADIPYRTAEGVADFHAAGRHTYITELLRNDVSLPEARELARHSDINMTMRYTHIGLEDQSKAIQVLPALQMRCISSDVSGLSEALTDSQTSTKNAQPLGKQAIVALNVIAVQTRKKWRRGEFRIQKSMITKSVSAKRLTNIEKFVELLF